MEFYEIGSLLKYQYMKDMETWEQARMLGFITARSNGTKIHKMEDLIKFSWEKKYKEKPRLITDEELQKYKNKAKMIIENNMLGE